MITVSHLISRTLTVTVRFLPYLFFDQSHLHKRTKRSLSLLAFDQSYPRRHNSVAIFSYPFDQSHLCYRTKRSQSLIRSVAQSYSCLYNSYSSLHLIHLPSIVRYYTWRPRCAPSCLSLLTSSVHVHPLA